MKSKTYTVDFVIDLTRQLIHLALNNEFDEFLNYVSEDFVYIADYDALYTKGRDAFAEMVRTEMEQPPVMITHEEYEILSHDRSLWITFGRVTSETPLPGGNTAMTKFHFTLTWKNINNNLTLIHAMGCHVPDVAAAEDKRVTKSMLFGQSTYYRQIHVRQNEPSNKLCFHASSGKYYYLYPEDILYIKANNHSCIIYTRDSSFSCSMKISSLELPDFYRVSNSYMVNTLYVESLKRFQVTLTNGSIIPVSRAKYMDFKAILTD